MVWCCKVADICYFTDTFGKHSLEILVVEPQSYHWVMSFLRGKIPFSQMDATFMADQLQVLHSKYSSVVTSRLIVREVKSAAIIIYQTSVTQNKDGEVIFVNIFVPLQKRIHDFSEDAFSWSHGNVFLGCVAQWADETASAVLQDRKQTHLSLQ